MAYPNYGYNNYGYIPGYAPGYTQPQYATNPYQNMQPVQTQAVPNTVIPPTTNKRLCISQEDAMSRQVENNSSYVYFDQNKDIMYEVNTDAWGKKTCNVYSLAVYKNPEVAEVRQTQRAIDAVNYNMATNTCNIQQSICNSTRDIIDGQRESTNAILGFLTNEKISSLQAQNAQLTAQLSQNAQTQTLINTLRPVASPAYITCSPYESAYGTRNGGCGCGCGC